MFRVSVFSFVHVFSINVIIIMYIHFDFHYIFRCFITIFILIENQYSPFCYSFKCDELRLRLNMFISSFRIWQKYELTSFDLYV